jgi:acetolactate synthase-1/3 small subunit
MNNKPTTMKLHAIGAYAEDTRGLVSKVMTVFTRAGYPVNELLVSRTDAKEVVLISLQVLLPEEVLNTVLKRLEKIIEVYRTTGRLLTNAGRKVGLFRLADEIFSTETLLLLQDFGAHVVDQHEGFFVVQKSGSELELERLHHKLEGKHLLGYFSVGLPDSLQLSGIDRLFEAAY